MKLGAVNRYQGLTDWQLVNILPCFCHNNTYNKIRLHWWQQTGQQNRNVMTLFQYTWSYQPTSSSSSCSSSFSSSSSSSVSSFPFMGHLPPSHPCVLCFDITSSMSSFTTSINLLLLLLLPGTYISNIPRPNISIMSPPHLSTLTALCSDLL